MELLYIAIAAVMVAIVYQDFKYRAIAWWWIPLLLVLLGSKGLLTYEATVWGKSTAMNLGFTLVQLLGVTAYFSLKEQRWVNIIDRYLGLGDVLFFTVVCLAFPPMHFVWWFLTGIVATIVGYGTYLLLHKSGRKEVPLAGAMAIWFLGFMCIENNWML